MMLSLRAIAIIVLLAAIMPSAARSQTIGPCCGSAPQPLARQNLTVEMRRATGQIVTFRLLQNGDAFLQTPEVTAGRIRGQRFLAVYDAGRWITAPPEVWQEALEGLPPLKGLERTLKSVTAIPMTRTGQSRVIAGVRGDVYRIGSLRGGATEAVFTRDPALEEAAQAYYDIFEVGPLKGSVAFAAAAARNAGFPLQMEGATVSRILLDTDRAATIRFPSSFVGVRALRRLMKSAR